MSDLDAFRSETAAWLEKNAPESLKGTRDGRFGGFWGGRKHPEAPADVLKWRDVMAERGWTAPTWPTEYGGGGLSDAEALVLDQELDRLQLPPAVVGFGLTMIGPTLLDYGTETQKKRHLPAICRGDVRWCQGYSEPGAGSDLAGLQTRAVKQGDKFIINGQKVWTSFADKSDWIFCLTRTDPDAKKQEGITFILVDMLQDGVTTRPIELISGSSPFCEVFLENAIADADDVVGEVNGGWTVAKALLGYERTMIGQSTSGQLSDAEQDLVKLASRHIGMENDRLCDPELRVRLAEYAMDAKCYELTVDRVSKASRPGPESSILKVVGSEVKQRRWELAMEIAGPAGLGWDGPGFDARELQNTRDWLRSRANSIEGGSSEIQMNVIAKRVLGLPT